MISRRRWLSSVVLIPGGFALLKCSRALNKVAFLGALEFLGEGRSPKNILLGEELDGRLFTDLASIQPDSLVIPTSNFFVRTRASRHLPPNSEWTLRIKGAKTIDLSLEDLTTYVESMGAHLIECAGNPRGAGFGMISVADWDGVPLSPLLERFGINGRVLVSGFDAYEIPSQNSIAGASWIFNTRDLNLARAFLAIGMNGAPLTPDHGAPVRLVVPGWYGCCCIKWVNEIVEVPEDASATSQMVEYARRTHQSEAHKLASSYTPAIIDFAAMPIRVEKWRIAGLLTCHVVGLSWGAPLSTQSGSLEISFDGGKSYTPVSNLEPRVRTWSVWDHWWVPRRIGRYDIRLRLTNTSLQTRRLDVGYYTRSVWVPEV